MALFNGARSETYANFNVDNGLQPGVAPAPSYQLPKPRSRRRCSLPLILSIATLMLSIAALGVAIDARIRLRRGPSRPGRRLVLLTSNPSSAPAGYKAVNIFMGTGYFARLQPMLYPRSDHKVIIVIAPARKPSYWVHPAATAAAEAAAADSQAPVCPSHPSCWGSLILATFWSFPFFTSFSDWKCQRPRML